MRGKRESVIEMPKQLYTERNEAATQQGRGRGPELGAVCEDGLAWFEP